MCLLQALKLSCGTVIRQNDGSQDELVRLYNELLSDNTPGITYANFSRYLEEQDGDTEDYMCDTAQHVSSEREGGRLNESFAIDTPLESLGTSPRLLSTGEVAAVSPALSNLITAVLLQKLRLSMIWRGTCAMTMQRQRKVFLHLFIVREEVGRPLRVRQEVL